MDRDDPRATRHSTRSVARRASAAVTLMTALLLSTAGLSLALGACGDGGPEPSVSTGSAGVSLAKSEVARQAPSASEADVASVATSMREFGVDLYGIMAQEKGDGNLVFSPASIITALTMTYAGAAGATAEEMAATLHFTLQSDALHQAFNSLDAALESRSGQQDAAGSDGQRGVLVKTANSLWAQKDLSFEPPFLDTLAAAYGAGVRLCDFGAAAEEAREAINEWVAEQTEDKIPTLLAPGTVDAMTRLVLVNAIYLDADWASPFDPNSTHDGGFTTLTGEKVTARMMYQESSFPYAAGDGWQAVELPYVLGELAMTLIVPDEGRFAEAEDAMATGLIDEVAGALSLGTDVNLTMPKFEFRTQAGLNDALTALGMDTAFTAGADFSGMTKQADLFISAVIHEAFIAVDEKGTEAAAATAVVMEEMAAMPSGQVTLTIDRPFIFALRDRATGAILFLGRVTDPTA